MTRLNHLTIEGRERFDAAMERGSSGLRCYTRHPNYFGDATLWRGFFVIAAGTTDGWVTAFSPAIMTFLLLRVSGVALLERGMKGRRPEYEDYVRRTSAFVPLPPKPKSGA